MKLQCWIYVSTEGVADRTEGRARLLALGERLKFLADSAPGLGYSATALYESGDFLEEDIERDLVESVTGGRLPAIVLNLTYDVDLAEPGGALVEAVLRDYGFRHALTEPALD